MTYHGAEWVISRNGNKKSKFNIRHSILGCNYRVAAVTQQQHVSYQLSHLGKTHTDIKSTLDNHEANYIAINQWQSTSAVFLITQICVFFILISRNRMLCGRQSGDHEMLINHTLSTAMINPNCFSRNETCDYITWGNRTLWGSLWAFVAARKFKSFCLFSKLMKEIVSFE